MLMVATIALVGVCVALAMLLFESKKIRELKDVVESNNKDTNSKIDNSFQSVKNMLVEGLQEVKDDADQKDQAFRTTLNDNNDMFSEAINQVAVASKEYTQEMSNATREELANSLSALENAIRRSEAVSQEYTNNLIQQSNDDFSEKFGSLAIALQKVLDDNKELKKKLEFFTGIREDSMQLNEDDDEEEREALIQKALEEIQQTRDPKQTIVGSTSSGVEVQEIKEHDEESTLVTAADVVGDGDNVPNGTGLGVLDEEQIEAFHLMNDLSENMFITGKAGTGKSFLLEIFERFTKKNLVKLAPTGIAAINIGGATLHSAFGYSNLEDLHVDEISPETIRLNSTKRLILKSVDTIVIDEISMVRADIFDKIDRILKVINNNEKPFGGKQMLVFGDLFQLPPIAKGQLKNYLMDKYGGIYFFQADAYDDGNFKFIELSTNHRQKDDVGFFDILNRIREGKISDDDISKLNTRKVGGLSEVDRILTLFPTKAQAEAVNRRNLDKIGKKIGSIEYVYKAKILFNASNNQTPNLDGNFQITSELRLRNGALVMMVANDPNKHWVNGTLGVISFLSEDTIKVTIKKVEYEVDPVVFSQREAVYSNGKVEYKEVLSVEQYPLVLAYAITIHKSQGMTYKRVACDISNCFAAGQAYVALSRCTNLNSLFLLNDVTHQSMGVEEEVRDFYLMQTTNIIRN